MGIVDIVLKDPKMIEITAIMGFGGIIWLLAMRELLRKDEVSDGHEIANDFNIKSRKQGANAAIPLTYITKEQIMDLTAEQLREIPESEVNKLPAVLRDMFGRRKNEVLLADRAKNNK